MKLSSCLIKTVLLFSFIFRTGFSFAGLNFDPEMLSDNGKNIADLSVFNSPGRQLPGSYDVDIYVNGSYQRKTNISFISTQGLKSSIKNRLDDTGLMACLNPALMQALGLNTIAIKKIEKKESSKCISLAGLSGSAYTRFNFKEMRLDINIPQAFLTLKSNDYISVTEWDNGINAVFFSWQYSGNRNSGNYGKSLNEYLNLTSGLNIGAWRLRDNRIWNRYSSNDTRQHNWKHLNTYLMRPIAPLKSNIVVGNAQSVGNVFESFSFTGVKIGTNLSMYSDTLQGFAPVIRGVASSNAEVYVRQNGNLIYRTAVPAGAFKINDLASVNNSGDLNVTIVEANGTKTHFVVPYSSVPVLQRKGRIVYSLASGKVRDTNNLYDPLRFVHGTLLWGLTDNTTIYGGTQLASRYKALAIGTGVNVGRLGAISADVTQAESLLANESKHTGASWRLMYARSMSSTGTTFQLMTNRFSTSGFYTLSETALKNMSGWMSDSGISDPDHNDDKINWSNHYNLYQPKKTQFRQM